MLRKSYKPVLLEDFFIAVCLDQIADNEEVTTDYDDFLDVI